MCLKYSPFSSTPNQLVKRSFIRKMDNNKESEILKIIDSLTTTGKKTLDEDQMKKLKKICKSSNDFVNYAYYALMTQLRKAHSEIRYSALLIINELFSRSLCFRNLLEREFDEFCELVVQTNANRPLPEPMPRAKELKLKALEFIQAWASKFGETHTRLQGGLQYLKKCKKVDFNDLDARTAAQREQDRKEQERKERVLNEKVLRIRSEMGEMTGEISNTLVQTENCFRLLVPHPTDELFSSQDFEIDYSKPSSSVQEDPNCENTLRQHGIYDMKKSITIEVKDNSEVAVKATEDTLPVIENLNDLYKEMTNRFLPMVTHWLKILTKGNNCTDALKRAIDLKRMIESAFQKYKDLKIKSNVPNFDDDDEDDDFVEVKEKEDYEAEVKNININRSVSQPSCSKNPTVSEKAYMWNFKHSEDDVKDPTSAVSTLTKRIANTKPNTPLPSTNELSSKQKDQKKSHKEELLNKAPILPYDIDLYHWEEEKPLIPEVVKFDSLHKFWETKNDDDENETLKEVQMASLRTRKIDFSGKFEPVKWSCRAPLPSGKLCPRKDRHKCPLHGKIIKRDSMGNPVDAQDVAGPSSSQTTVPEWQDPELLKEIEAATGMNLKLPPKKGKRKGEKLKGGLTNIKIVKTTAKERLTKKILKRYKHYASKIDEAEQKQFNDKFGDQWNYY